MISRVKSIYSLYSGLRSIEHARNRPFSSCLKPLFQSQVKCKAIDMQMRSLEKAIQMKPLQQYFHMVLFFSMLFYLLSLWMKSYVVTIQMKPLQQYFHMVLFI